MNALKRIIILIIATAAMTILELFNIVSSMLDWLMILVVTSDKLCVNCGHQSESITRKTPLCEECATEIQEDMMEVPKEIGVDTLRMYR